MKSKILIIFNLIFIINVIFFNINVVQADGISDVITGGDSFVQAGKNENVTIDKDKIQKTSNTIYNILLISGMCIAVVISGILGIQFMIGSAEEKAKIKDALIPFVIGCIVIFGAFGFWKIFITIGNDFTETETTQTTESVTGYCSKCKKTVKINQKTGACSKCGTPVSLTK